jgi:carboxyl-terminal processing protease
MIAEKQALSLCAVLLLFVGGQILLCQAAEGDVSVAKEQPAPKAVDETLVDEQQSRSDYYELLDSFVDTLDQIDRNYVKNVDRKRLMEAAIRGMLLELDPYSNYIPPEQLDQFRSGVEGEFGGIGVQAAIDNGVLKVISPFVGTPAYRSGMMADDVILEIDGRSTKGITLDQAVRWMKGVVGSEVVLRVRHPDASEPESITLKRERIRVRTVFGYRRNPDDSWRWMYDGQQKIGYVRISGFSRHTAEELRAALEMLTEQGLRGFVLDLRFNPGGLLSAAIEVSDLFVSEGRIVSTEGRNVESRAWDAERKGTYDGFPMAVLVNRYSASASEIVAACLQDHQRAVIIGTRTWGKGNVQNVIQLADGLSALKLTTANYHRPNGKEIHRFPDSKETDQWGVTPDEQFRVSLTRKERSELVQRQREIDILRPQNDATVQEPDGDKMDGETNQDATEAEANTEEDSSELDDFVDPQLQKSLDYLVQKLAIETNTDNQPSDAQSSDDVALEVPE